MLDVVKFYRDFNIPFVESGHKHCRPGWVQVECPFCSGNPGYHLGFCLNPSDKFAGKWICWRCGGGKSPTKVIHALTNISVSQAKEVYRKYGGKRFHRRVARPEARRPQVAVPIRAPYGAVESFSPHVKAYLLGRGFENVDELQATWGLLATGPLGPDKFRIIIPITLNGIMVSYQGRDYTGKAKIPYKACPKRAESVFHKSIVGGIDQAADLECGMLVEGFFDAFRMGQGALPTFGIKYRREQIHFVSKRFKKLTVLFDGGEKQAIKQAKAICADLAQRGVEAQIYELESGDPGSLSPSDAKWLRGKLL